MRDMLEKLSRLEVAGIPIGAPFLLLASMGIAEGVAGLLSATKVPPIATGPGLAFLSNRFLRRFLGDAGSRLFATGAVMGGVDLQLGVISRISALVSKVKTSGVPVEGWSGAEALGEAPQVPALGGANLGEAYITDVEEKLQAALAAG